MMSHLKGIEDVAIRDGVFKFQIEMELVVLSLLADDRDVALAQIEVVCAAMFEHVTEHRLEMLTPDERAKSETLAIAMLKRSFEHLRLAIADPDGSGGSTTRKH